MCLSIAVDYPDRVLSRGDHEGFEWLTVNNNIGYRCGYVRIPVDHPWHGKDYNNIRVAVHGGLTFSEPDKPCDADRPDDAWWVGFDCAHCDDAPDPSLPGYDDYGLSLQKWLQKHGVIRTTEYVEAECRSLCEQAKAAVAA